MHFVLHNRNPTLAVMPSPANIETVLPAFITFTGVDARTPIEQLVVLAGEYPVEFAFLLSPSRQGTGRLPSLDFVREALACSRSSLNWAIHLCDEYSEQIAGNQTAIVEGTGCLAGIRRLQINMKQQDFSTSAIRAWTDTLDAVTPILNCRSPFPEDNHVLWLSDASEGTGTRPKTWPVATGQRRVGYAGGINADNVADVVRELGVVASDYWIDMASGVRNAQGHFDVSICRKVCEAVYGVRA